MMLGFALNIFKAVGLWIAIIAGSILAAGVVDLSGGGGGTDGPLTGEQAFLVVNGLHAIVISILAANAIVRGWRLALLITTTLYAAQSFLLFMEAVYFIDSIDISLRTLIQGSLHALLVSVAAGLACGLLWRAAPAEATARFDVKRLLVRIALVAAVYIVCYFLAGFFIAWSVPAVQEYYSFGQKIELLPLLSFQVLRGSLWALLAFYMVRSMRGSAFTKAVIVGAVFSVLAIAQLLYPNPFMPWGVRLPHMVEVAISNFVFGVVAGLILQSFEAVRISDSDAPTA